MGHEARLRCRWLGATAATAIFRPAAWAGQEEKHKPGVHVAKAIGLGILGAAMSGVCALLIYDHYPRPGYWTLDLSEVLIFAYYFVLPIFSFASALLGGLACGRIQWMDLPEHTA